MLVLALHLRHFAATQAHRSVVDSPICFNLRTMRSLKRQGVVLLVGLALTTPAVARACSSCGCTLSSDWAAQGYTAGEGLRVDFLFTYFNQTQLRTGTGTVDRASITFPTDREIQQTTVNRNYSLNIDYSPNTSWGINVLIPYFDRFHTTIAAGDTEISSSHTTSIGDMRLVGRYQGFTPSHNLGVQLGVKLATGSFDNNFISGPQAGTPLDRGLQPGTGTTDLLVGVYYFDNLGRDWGYFAQALVQQPLNSRDGFRPGTGLNVNLGVRYLGFETVIPNLQLNVRTERPESGVNADVENSGATLAYLSPGLTINLTHKLQVYGFLQVPIYQRVNGFQLEARYTVSGGIHYSF
jgi:hypothetical protein